MPGRPANTRHRLSALRAAPLLRALAPPAARITPSNLTRLHTLLASHSPAAAPALLPLHSADALPTPAAPPATPICSAPVGNGPPAAPCSPAHIDPGRSEGHTSELQSHS